MHTKGKPYAPAMRARVLAAAVRENLTGEQVGKKFGISPITFYNWRNRAKANRPKVARPATKRKAAQANGDAGSLFHDAVRTELKKVLAEMLDLK